MAVFVLCVVLVRSGHPAENISLVDLATRTVRVQYRYAARYGTQDLGSSI